MDFSKSPTVEGFSWNQTACVHQNLISKVPFGNVTCRTCHEVWYNIDRTFVNSFFPITQNEQDKNDQISLPTTTLGPDCLFSWLA